MESNYDLEGFFGALTRLVARYPTLIRHLSRMDLTVDITFYIEELAMECTQSLLDAGITTVHRLDRPRVISVQLPSLLAQHKTKEAIQTLDTFLRVSSPGVFNAQTAKTLPPSVPEMIPTIEKKQQLLSPVWQRIFPITVARGEGAYLYTNDGCQFLDFTSGIGVTNTGHSHPCVVQAIQEQAARIIHAQINICIHEPMLQLMEGLRQVVPSGLDTFFFSNSGAEAVEAAVKLARQATSKPNIIVFQGSFHGRTMGTMSLTTSKTIYRLRYQPLMPGVFVAPYPYTYRYGWDAEECSQWCLGEVRHLLHSQTDPTETAAILIEPVLGEGGYVVPPCSFLSGVRELCDECGILLILDEAQSGFGRTGRFFALEHFGVVPDILVMAKAMASGMPLSGIAASRELMERWEVGSHGGTYGGNAVACAAAVATLQVLREEGLVDNAARQGEYLLKGLQDVAVRYPVIGDVRGLGLMVATEFTMLNGQPDPTTAQAVQEQCFQDELLLLTCGTYSNVIRWIPPLIVTEEQVEKGIAVFGEALAEAMADR